MNILKYLKIHFVFTLILLFSACGTEEVDPGIISLDLQENIGFPNPQELISSSVTGRVVDVADAPIVGAVVHYLSGDSESSTQTDDTGNFLFENIINKGASAYLRIEYPGKFDGYRRLGLVEDNYNYTEVKLQDKELLGTILSSQGGTLTSPTGAAVVLPADGIISSDGSEYQGSVEVYMSWIDPSSADLSQLMVGDLSGVDEDGGLRALATFGMLNVELTDESGNELNIQDGSTAELSFPVPNAMASSAPDVIPLWSFNEEEGYWVEESAANLINGNYVGEVPHFSTWNADLKIDAIDICGAVVLEYGRGTDVTVGASYYKIVLSNSTIGNLGGWLTNDGQFNFLNVPMGEELILEITDLCGDIVYSETIGPFEEDVKLDDIMIPANSVSFHFVSGNGVDCDGVEILDGLVRLDFNNDIYTYPLDSEGNFNFPVPICENFDGELSVIDRLNGLMSEPILITQLDSIFHFEDIYVCNELGKFFKLNIEGVLDTIFLDDFSTDGTWFVNDTLGNSTSGFGLFQNAGMNFQFHIYFEGEIIVGGTNNVLPGAMLNFFSIEILQGTAWDQYIYASENLQVFHPAEGEGIFSGVIKPVDLYVENSMWVADILDEEIEISGSWKGL